MSPQKNFVVPRSNRGDFFLRILRTILAEVLKGIPSKCPYCDNYRKMRCTFFLVES